MKPIHWTRSLREHSALSCALTPAYALAHATHVNFRAAWTGQDSSCTMLAFCDERIACPRRNNDKDAINCGEKEVGPRWGGQAPGGARREATGVGRLPVLS